VMGGLIVLSQPEIFGRWTERLFNQAGGVTSKDISWLTREAEAKAMWDILKQAPMTFIYGQGVGADYYWDTSYYPELYLVYPADFDFSGDFWFAGHSVWTYALFSGGALGVLCHLALFGGVMALCLRSVYVNRPRPGFRLDYAFLPFVAAWCLLSESATSNPLDERLAGLVFGMMAGLPQVLFCRARAMLGERDLVHGVDRRGLSTRVVSRAGNLSTPPFQA
jgi:O-antigen ligase